MFFVVQLILVFEGCNQRQITITNGSKMTYHIHFDVNESQNYDLFNLPYDINLRKNNSNVISYET